VRSFVRARGPPKMSKTSARISSVMIAVGLSACSIADHFQAESRMNASQDAYRKCLGENTREPKLCDPP
jgi:hypothetical protein